MGCDGCALREVFLSSEGLDLSFLNRVALFLKDVYPIVMEYVVSFFAETALVQAF